MPIVLTGAMRPYEMVRTDALQNLTSLTDLVLWEDQIQDISALGNLVNMRVLDLDTNVITSIESLEFLTEITTVWLINNNISSFAPLEDNDGLGAGDNVYMSENFATSEAASFMSLDDWCSGDGDILGQRITFNILGSRGVNITHDCN